MLGMSVIPSPSLGGPSGEHELALPFVLFPDALGMASEGLAGRREDVRNRLLEHGSVLLRGFGIDNVDDFDATVRALAGTPLTYHERSSPRSTIKNQVYTSTDYPSSEEIFLHNENSYQASWPLSLFFCCLDAPDILGATPLADIRQVYQAIDPAVRAEFEARDWMVVRNFSENYGLPWQQTFNSDDRDEVDAYCGRNGVQTEWLGGNRLRTRARRKAVHEHWKTGEPVWFNHLTFFHVTSLAPDVSEGLRALFDEAELPTNTYYGDGEPVPDEVIAHLRDCYRAAQRRFDWQVGDVLMVDNMLAAHGREPFTGTRKIAVAMAEPWSDEHASRS